MLQEPFTSILQILGKATQGHKQLHTDQLIKKKQPTKWQVLLSKRNMTNLKFYDVTVICHACFH